MIREKKIDPDAVRDPKELQYASFLEEFSIAFIYLFGSFSDTLRPLSDIDLAYKSDRPLTFDEETELHYRLCSFLRTNEVDLVRFDSLPVVARYGIISRGSLLICRNPILLADFKEHIFTLYPDMARMTTQYLHDFFHSNKKAV